MQTIAVARQAMATRFELLLHGDDAVALRAAGGEALNEVDRLEARLSLYRPTSEISHINARAAHEAVRVSPQVFALLQQAQQLSRETSGAFDITIAPLVRCWGFMGGTGKMPEPAQVEEARAKVGMHLMELNTKDSTIRFTRPGMMLDLGAIGKGFALECAAELLRDAGVTSALLHGGTSTIYAIGHPPDAEAWKVALEYPTTGERDSSAKPRELITTVSLCDEALSVSAVWGRSFKADGKTFGHVLDPRSGQPVHGAMLAAVALPSATETDALSTALLVGGQAQSARITALRPGMRTVVVSEDSAAAGKFHVVKHGAF